MEIIDADGHVNDAAGQEEIAKYMPGGNRSSQIFPDLDHLHFHYLRPGGRRSGLENPGPDEWVKFLDETGISWSVLYPTFGLAVGRFVSVHWAVAACRAYNNWLHEKFISKNSRLKGMALLPIQDVEAAVVELRRAVVELGMAGGMLPSNGEGIKDHLGAKLYWPIYEEAENLGCAWPSTWDRSIISEWMGSAPTIRFMPLGTPSASPSRPPGCWPMEYSINFRRFESHFSRAVRLGCRFSSTGSTAPIIRAISKWILTTNWSVAPKWVRRRATIFGDKSARAESSLASMSMMMV